MSLPVSGQPQPGPPSLTDGFVATISERLGGPIGRHAAAGRHWWNPARVALLTGTLVYLAGVLFRQPCRNGQDHFKYLCYSDIPLLYPGRGLLEGNTPYLDSGNYPVLEYPVLTGWFLELERILTRALGGAQGVGLTEEQIGDSTRIFMDVNIVLLGALFLIAVWAQVHTPTSRPWDAMMLAASPCVAAAALINWDMLPIALTAVGMLAWARRRPALAGVLFGLGMAAKLYPLFLLGPLLLLCLRARRKSDFMMMLSTFVVSWGLVNLPALWLAPAAWRSFWEFNSTRSGDLGSIWYVLSLAGHPVERLNLASAGLFALGCVGIAALIILAPRRPRFGAMAFLVLAAFLLTNKVYSPQYVLWLLPFMILARPRWRDWLIFTAGELIYFVAIWWHLGGYLAPGDSSADRIYWLAVITRLATQSWVVIMVVRDALQPESDPVRAGGVDDPTGGVLDGAPDAGWWARRRMRTEPVEHLTTSPLTGSGRDDVV
ncbi:MAG TPA: glycosyltransferase 87 family protein [Propionibacteriaceae bacterium]|nr:glycosyltransferase 87 family protein [Propionibacteriaceae bacterium]